MKFLITCIVTCAILLSGYAAASSVDTYQFSKPEYENRFHQLNKILRCPKCQNQNLADSNSMISQDLRREVFRLMEEGRSDDQIIEFLVMRYGDFVLYKPKFDGITYFLWLGPIGFGLFGALIIAVVVIRQRGKRKVKANGDTAEHLSSEEQAKLDKILNNK